MADGQVQETREGERWRRGPELPTDVFGVLHKPNRAINPISIVATVDRDGTPRTAPPGCCGGPAITTTTPTPICVETDGWV